MVSIMPGIDARAPLRTETSRGFCRIAEPFAGDLLGFRDVLRNLVQDVLCDYVRRPRSILCRPPS